MAFRNVFACLVHERQDCVIDLVRSLRRMDPDSTILLYNGGEDPRLLDHPALSRFGVVRYPAPRRMHWGWLHDFAIDCMRFAVKHLTFDLFTIVDSDQMPVRSGYSGFMAHHLARRPEVGLLGSSAVRQLPHTRVGPAHTAFKEIELWRPFLRRFRDGERKFVYWTFWPTTAFTASAVRDLVDLFSNDAQLQDIMRQTRIFATEEVIFPTLVALLGYKVGLNPCGYDFVKYKIPYTLRQMDTAISRSDVFWVHPIRREFDDPLRHHLRERFQYYRLRNDRRMELPVTDAGLAPSEATESILDQIRDIDGWLADEEAVALVTSLEQTLARRPDARAVVEVGSYCGKATVAMGAVVRALCPDATIFAVDPFDGKVGAADQQITAGPPTLHRFQENIRKAGLGARVKAIAKQACEVSWDKPIQFLLIDGLHDFENVSRDFLHFEPWLEDGACVAFHDYADYFPGVKAFVHELLMSGDYRLVRSVGSLVVLCRAGSEQRSGHSAHKAVAQHVTDEVVFS